MTLTEKYALESITAVAKEIEMAAQNNHGQIEIIELTSKLLGVCRPLRVDTDPAVEESRETRAA